jgi:PPIC-type PPIASE domain/SurA N-terminal domain
MVGAKGRAPYSSSVLLGLGAALGVFVAAVGILQPRPSGELPPQAVAMVNGTYILRADYDRTLAAVTEAMTKNEGQAENAEALKQRTLDRLIDEELLVQRGIELGLAERDPQLRTQVSSRVLEMVAMAREGDETVDEKTLRAFYEKEPGRFRVSGRFRVDVIFFAVPTGAATNQDAAAKKRALDAYERLQKKEPFDVVSPSGDPLLITPPDAALPIAKLQDYLGATATRVAVELQEGQFAAPVRGSDGYRILRLVERIEGETPAFEAVRKDVENAYRKQEEDARLRRFLDRRRASAQIAIQPAL